MNVDLLKLKTAQWVTLIGSLGTVVSLLALWDSPYRILAIAITVVLIIATAVVELHIGRINVFFSGIVRYYPTFPISKTSEVLSQVTTEYSYFGISFASIISTFRLWYLSSERRANVRIRLVLLDPEAQDILEYQARYERNLWGVNLDLAQRLTIDDTIKRTRDSITFVLDTLATLPPTSPPIEVYFHREKIRKWMHVIDNNLIYAGMLALGSDGLQSPVLELNRNPGKWLMFDYFREEWESAMQVARRIEFSR